MKRTIIRVVLWALLAFIAIVGIQLYRNWDIVQRVFLGGVKVYESTPPTLPADLPRPAILVFSKTNGFRHEEAIPAARTMFSQLAQQNGWSVYQTENGATFTPELLARFDVVIFSNTTGDVFTPAQRAAFQGFLNRGGGYVGIHGAGDNSHEAWGWYVDHVIGTHFTGHPMKPQFQQATVRIENPDHPANHRLGSSWQRTDEWYSFTKSPRGPGTTVLATLDERSYNPEGMFGSDLRMGQDHPITWTRCVGRGRIFYTALGHTAETYAEPRFRQMLTGAVQWALRQDGEGCDTATIAPE